MSALPREVLLHVIRHLNKDELLQCQLTCKHWYKVSLALLYATLDINSKKTAVLYTRTISNSPQLGKYLKIIHFHDVFEGNSGEISSFSYGVLDTAIRHCPNITRMGNTGKKGFPFWTQLMHASTQGQLSNLKSLPQSSSIDLISYIYTALAFKNSLARLWLYDDNLSFGPQLAHLGAYQTLCDQIDQFKNLESLALSCLSDQQLSYFDGLIDKCHHLKDLDFDLTISKILPPSEIEPGIRPRPDIHTFVCNWKLIDAESQLEYVMCKFPNLKKLIITPEPDMDDDTLNCSGHTLIKFIRYALSILYFKIEIDTSHDDLLNIWAEVMKTKHGFTDLTIAYQSINDWNTIELSSESGVKLFFPLDTDSVYDDEDDDEDEDEPPHIQFFSEVGGTIRSLIVNTSEGIPSMNDEDSPTIDWLYDILQRCPLIEEITTPISSNLSMSHRTLQYPSVKKLAINLSEYSSSTYSLDCLSLNLPNLRQLSFDLDYVKACYKEPIVIHMPHTSLNLLTWSETKYSLKHFRGAEVYIKLKTDASTKFYLGIRNSLFQIDSKRYLFYSKCIRFDINCKQLKELRVRRITSPESDASLVF